MQPETTRRALLRGAGIAIAITAAPVAVSAAATNQSASASAALLALIADAEAAEHRQVEHNRTICEPALARLDSAVAAAEAANPHFTIDAGPSVGGGRVIWSTAKPTSVSIVRAIVEMEREGKDMSASGLAEARKLYAAHLRRTRAIDRVRRAHDVSDVLEANEALCELTSPAQDAVAAFECRTIADLHTKLAFMVVKEMGDGVDWTGELLADAKRLTDRGDQA